MNEKEIIKLTDKYILKTYGRSPVALVSGKGAEVRDAGGRKYLDFFSGLAVNNLGQCHPAIVKAVCAQARKLMHTSNLYYTQPQAELAQKLIRLSFPGKVFVCNSGAEANEAAIKLARKYGNPGRNGIITMKESFHGRTVTTITATGQTKYQKGFQPLARGFKYVPFNDINAVKKMAGGKTVAIMVEPIQGEGGVNIAEKKFLKGLRELCDKKKMLLIFDEVQTGIGRTGKMFAFQYYGADAVPDMVTLAKALGGGLPIGAMIVRNKHAGVLKPGMHASTFGGNPVVCAASCAVLDTIKSEGLLAKALSNGKYFLQKLNELKKKHAVISEVRGMGMMIGVELKREGKEIAAACLKKGLLTNCTAEKVIRFLPPLIVTKKQIDKAVSIFESVLKNAHSS